MAKSSVAFCFALLAGVHAVVVHPPANHMSALNVNASSASKWPASSYTGECWMKRHVNLLPKSIALFQTKVSQKPDDADADDDESDWDMSEVGGDGDGDGDGDSDGDGDGDGDGSGNGAVDGNGNGAVDGSPTDGAPVPTKPDPAPPTTVTVLKDGFMRTTCVKDYMYYHGDKHGKNRHSYELQHSSRASIVHYNDAVPKEDREQMTPKVCFEFCRTVPDMGFFGILNGRGCYCTPYFQQMAGDSSQCDAVCPGDPTNMCGGKSKSQIYEMHMCSSTESDLQAAAAKAAEADTELHDQAKVAHDRSHAMQYYAQTLQENFGAVGDKAVTELMQTAKVTAGEVERAGLQVLKVGDQLTELRGKAKGASSVRESESIEEAIKKTLVHSKTVSASAEKLLAETTAPTGAGKTGNDKQYYSIMYFIDKDFVSVPTTCSGETIGKPMAEVPDQDACSRACDEHVDKCNGYLYFAKEQLCFLMSKFKTASYYTGCPKPSKPKAFLQQDKVADVACMAKFSEFSGTSLKPDGSGKCKQCLKKLTKADRCFKETPPMPGTGLE